MPQVSKHIKGAHRVGKLKYGKRVETGSYIIQFTTRFPHCKRLQLTTSVYPVTNNAATIIAEMKLMLKEMNRTADVERFIQMRDGKLKLCDVYTAWKTGKEHLLQGNEYKLLLPELEAYRTSGIHAAYTALSAKRWIATFKKKQFISESHKIADLPQIVQKTQHHYMLSKKHDMFNLSRQYFLGFLRKHCGHSSQSPLYQSVQRIESLKVSTRRLHHPFETPRDVYNIIDTINSNKWIPDDKKQMYADSLLMMTFHPFRPTEFFQLKWERDTLTGHLRIKGTKTDQSVRVVPMLLYPTQYRASTLSDYRLSDRALNKVLAKTGTLSRSRDCRRTWSVWAEKAHLARSHIISYLGHKGRQMTDLYQARAITRAELDEDCIKLQTFIKQELSKEHVKPKSHFAPNTRDATFDIRSGSA